MGELRLEELSASNIVAANRLTLKPGQEQFVAPVAQSISEAAVSPESAWPRVVLDGDDVVGFILGNFDPDSDQETFRCCIWRISVTATAQGHGVGRFAVRALAQEAQSRGFERVTVVWDPSDDGPEAFFLKSGFEKVGETEYGETIGALTLETADRGDDTDS